MKERELIDGLRQQTGLVPHGAKERVFRRLAQPRALGPARPLLAFAVALSLGFAVVAGALALRTRPVPAPARPLTFGGSGFAVVTTPGAQLTPRGPASFALASGGLAASAWSHPLELTAAGKTVRAEAARFTLEVAGESVVLGVDEGVVMIEGEQVVAPARWPVAAQPAVDVALVRSAEPPGATDDRAWRLAEDAARAGQVDRALEQFRVVSSHDGLRAEAALLRQGQLLLWSRHDAAAALEVLDQGARRFPAGSLAQDTALSRLEALAALGRPELPREAKDFLARYPENERRAEVCRLGRIEKCER